MVISNSRWVITPPILSSIPMPDFQPDGLVVIHFLLDYYKLAGADFVEQPLMNVFLHHSPAQFLTQRAQLVVGVALAGDADGSPAARIARKRDGNRPARDAYLLIAPKLVGDQLALGDFEVDLAAFGLRDLGLIQLDGFVHDH